MYTNCRRCNRPLRSEESRTRGYGSYCYSKVSEKIDVAKVNTEEEKIKGQMDLLEELRDVKKGVEIE